MASSTLGYIDNNAIKMEKQKKNKKKRQVAGCPQIIEKKYIKEYLSFFP